MTQPKGPILLINPNSCPIVTEAIAEAVTALAPVDGSGFETHCISHGPKTIATQAHAAQATLDVAEVVEARTDASAFIIACFSDPGLELCRSLVHQPVFGIQEAGILTAMAQADLFGIVALGPASLARHRLRIRQMGVEARLAEELALDNVSAKDAGKSDAVYEQTLVLGNELKSRGAGAIVLGCAGFSPRRAQLEKELQIPVVDPVIAAAAMALGSLR